MAGEIIGGERHNNRRTAFYYYEVPTEELVDIGSTGTHPVPSPTEDLPQDILLVLTTDEKTKLDAGESILFRRSVTIPYGTPDAEVVAELRGLYAKYGPRALAEYISRYEYIGTRIDKA